MTDGIRQVANVVGAVFQVVAGPVAALLYGTNVGEVSEANDTLVVPAGYAFAIWGPIFALCLAYAVYQALPSSRESALLRRVGWFTAGAFLLAGAWSLVFPARLFVLAQIVILGVFLCAVAAFMLIPRATGGRPTSRSERWLVALPVGLLAGWITAATTVGVATTLVGVGVFGGGGAEAVLGSVLLICGGLVAAVVIRAAAAGPVQGTVAYAAAVLWALAGVVVNQYAASALTTVAAGAAAVPVVLALLAVSAGAGPRHAAGRRVA